MDLEHPTTTPVPVVTEDQVTEDPATLEADCQDIQVKCKYCDRHFKNVAEHNMHVNSAQSHKSRAAVDYTAIGVEPHGPNRGMWPIAAVTNDSQSHLVASSI